MITIIMDNDIKSLTGTCDNLVFLVSCQLEHHASDEPQVTLPYRYGQITSQTTLARFHAGLGLRLGFFSRRLRYITAGTGLFTTPENGWEIF